MVFRQKLLKIFSDDYFTIRFRVTNFHLPDVNELRRRTSELIARCKSTPNKMESEVDT